MQFFPTISIMDGNRARRIAIGLGCLAVVTVLLAGSLFGPIGALLAASLSLCAVLAAVLFMRSAQLDTNARQLNKLQRLQAQHETAEKMAALGLWGLDLHNRQLSFSPGAFRVFNIDPDDGEPDFNNFIDGIHEDDRKRWSDVHRRAVRRKTEVKVEYRFVDRHGNERWLRSIARPVRRDDGKKITRIEGTVQDISGMRAMQRQLASSEAKFRDLTQLSSDWVWETDTQDRISYVSDSIDAVLGPWARRAIGQRRWDDELPDVLPTDWPALKAALAGRHPIDDFEFTRLDENGKPFHLSISGRPVFDDQNNFIGYRGTGHNISREKQQRMLLELDGDIAAIMREQNDPDKVISAIIITVCGKLGWLGGLRLVRDSNRAGVQERWGYPAFTRMVLGLPREMATDDNSVETKAWETGKPIWVQHALRDRKLSKRYRLKELGGQAVFITPITDENGDAQSALLFVAPLSFRDDQFLGEIAAVLSRTLSLYLNRTNAEKQLRHASQHDALTGLPNRVFVREQLELLLRKKHELAVLYIDLDRYKIINDTLGHSAGDKALIEVARRISKALTSDNVAGRLGGDEFVAVLQEPGSREQVELAARQILRAIEQPLVLNDRAYFLSASIGVAMAPEDSNNAARLIKAADAAMYQVKSEGRNDVRFFSGDLNEDERSEKLQLAAEMPQAMQRGEVELFYQPVLDVSARKVLSIEGLMRWRHPTLGLLLPDRFLPAAEESNLIREIGFWAIRRAIDDRRKLGLSRYGELAVSVNTSVRQLTEDDFLENLSNLLKEKRFPPQLLRLELTESSFIENPEQTVQLISELRRLGVKVIIDNFGTGYASLSYIKDLPVDGLKIDRAFVTNLPEDRGNAAIVQAVTTLAGKLGMQAMAEGVETAQEMRGLREMQCDVMQGALICEPVAMKELREFLDSLPGLRRMHAISPGSKRDAA